MAKSPRQMVKLNLTVIEASALLQLAGEADFDTFRCCGDSKRTQAANMVAGERALDRLAAAIRMADQAVTEKPAGRAAGLLESLERRVIGGG